MRAWVCIFRSNIKPAPKAAHNYNPRAPTGGERRWRWGSWVNLMYAVAKQANKNKIMTTTKIRSCLYQCGRQTLVTDMARYLPHGCCGNTCAHNSHIKLPIHHTHQLQQQGDAHLQGFLLSNTRTVSLFSCYYPNRRHTLFSIYAKIIFMFALLM